MPSELEQIRAELAENKRRIDRAETLLAALLEWKKDQPVPLLVDDIERARRDRIAREFAELQAEVEARRP